MARKKPAPSPRATGGSTTRSKTAVSTTGSGTTKTTRPVSPATTKNPRPKPEPRNLALEEIGLVAGLVWQLLNDKGEQSLSSIKGALDAPSDSVIAAIGWLAREDKLSLRTSGRSVLVSLR